MKFIKSNKWLIILLTATLIKGIFWAYAFPVFQAPDEDRHFACVQYIAENKRLFPDKNYQGENLPSEQLTKAKEVLNFDAMIQNPQIHQDFKREAKADDELIKNANAKPTGNYPDILFAYPPYYYALNAPIYYLSTNVFSVAIKMRIFSVILSLITICLIYLAFGKLFNSKNLALIGAALISFLPQFSHISASINPDNLLNLAFAGFFWTAINNFDKKFTKKQLAWFVFWIILGIGSKPQGYLLIVFLFLYLLFKLNYKNLSWKSLFFYSMGITSAAFAVIYTFYKVALGQDFFKMEIYQKYFAANSPIDLMKLVFLSRISRTFKSFFARFGWLDTLVSSEYYLIIIVILIISVGGLIYSFWKNKVKREELYLWLCLIVLELVYMVLFVRNAIFYGDYNFPTQGRYYFIVLMPIFYFILKGILALIPKKWQKAGLIILVYGMIYFNMAALVQFILKRYYI